MFLPKQTVITKTPLRISFLGGGSDYPQYYLRKKGAVLGTTINKYIYIHIHRKTSFFSKKYWIGYSKVEHVDTVSEIQHPSIKACLKELKIADPLNIHIFADIPAKTGLGSSSAFTVGFLHALHEIYNRPISTNQLAKDACFIEQSVIRENVGSQDQYHASFGGWNIFHFNKDQITHTPIDLSIERTQEIKKHTMFFFTGMTRFANEVLKDQIEKMDNKLNDEIIEQMYELVFEGEKLITQSPLQHLAESLGNLLHQSWELKKKLSQNITNSTIDHYYQIAMENGAFGGKLCGAGNGGFLLILAPIGQQKIIREKLKDLIEIPLDFSTKGSSVIYSSEN